MKILSSDELRHTGTAEMREYCVALAASLRDATEDLAIERANHEQADADAAVGWARLKRQQEEHVRLRRALTYAVVDVLGRPGPMSRARQLWVGDARKLLEGDDASM